MPQRTAHEIVGKLVRKGIERGVPLAELSLAEFREAHSTFDQSVYDVLGAERAVAAFASYGSTAPEEVDRQIALWTERLAQPATQTASGGVATPT